MSDDVKVVSSRSLPGKTSNNVRGPLRGSQFGEVFTSPIGESRYAMLDQGTYYVAHNTTNDASSTLAHTAGIKLADNDATMTKPFIFARMNPSSGLRAYLDYIEIEVVTAATSAQASNWAAQIDTGASRVTTAGTALTTVNTNMQSGNSPDLAVQGGVIVVSAETASCRNLGFGQIRAAIDIAGDRMMFRFGDEPSSGDNVVASAASRHLITLPPVILGPQDSFLLGLYDSTDNASGAGVYKVRMGWWEF
jgi:hypothetical protein